LLKKADEYGENWVEHYWELSDATVSLYLRMRSDSSSIEIYEENIRTEMSDYHAQLLEKYLESRDPYEQLEELKAISKDLRGAIEHNFSIQDILIEMDDKCFKRQYEWGWKNTEADDAYAKAFAKAIELRNTGKSKPD
jgi:predicted transcriptional regulator